MACTYPKNILWSKNDDNQLRSPVYSDSWRCIMAILLVLERLRPGERNITYR